MRESDRKMNRRNVVAGATAATAGLAMSGLAKSSSSQSIVAMLDQKDQGGASQHSQLLMAQNDGTPIPTIHYDVTGWIHSFDVGELKCLAVSDGSSLNNDPNDFLNFYNLAFGPAPAEKVEAELNAAGYEKDQLIRQDTCVLIDTGEQLVLVDTGFGSGLGGILTANLRGAGVEPEDIDVVVCTHGHPDHIGGNVDETGVPTFPNARYVMSEAEWNFWANDEKVELAIPNDDIREVLLGFVHTQMFPIADRFDLIGYEVEIVPGIISIASPGHTPGHMALLVQSGDEKLWIGGDSATHPIDMPNPSFAGLADIDPEEMENSRRSLFQRIADEGGLALFGHFDPFPGIGTVSVAGDAWSWNPMS